MILWLRFKQSNSTKRQKEQKRQSGKVKAAIQVTRAQQSGAQIRLGNFVSEY